MEEDINEPSSSMLPVALGVLAMAIGGAGLYFGITASQQISPITESMEAASGSSARIEKQFETFEVKLAELTAQTNELQQTVNRLRVYSSQTERDVKAAMSGVESNREEMIRLVQQFKSGFSGARPQPATESSNSSVASTDTVDATIDESVSGSASVYKIQSGDNFAKIAAAKGIGLQALLDANPGVDPRRLQIGQEITIPAN